MRARTDLIEEKSIPLTKETTFEKTIGNCKIREISFKEKGETKKYITLCFPPLESILETMDIEIALNESLKRLLPYPIGRVLIVGLGNTDITPDALGPFCADRILATRHLSGEDGVFAESLELKEVAVIIPGVLGKTGIEAAQTVAAVCKIAKPQAVIVIDSLAAADVKRLCTTIQLTNTGISPGSGVKNSRKELSQGSLGVPVVAIGMPTVIDAELGEKNTLMVTPKDIDLQIRLATEIIANALNGFLQPSLDRSTLKMLT